MKVKKAAGGAAFLLKIGQSYWDISDENSGVPCRHHIHQISAGELRGFFNVKKIVPANVPAKYFQEAFL